MELEVTWKRAIKVWWACFWRGLLFGFLGGLAVGLIIGVIFGILNAAVLHADSLLIKKDARLGSLIIGLLVGIPIHIYVFKIVLTKKFKEFRIALIKE